MNRIECISLLNGKEMYHGIYLCDTFKTNVSYGVPLKILLDYFEQELEHKYVPMGRGLRAVQPSLPAHAAACTPSHMPGEQSHSCTAFPSTL